MVKGFLRLLLRGFSAFASIMLRYDLTTSSGMMRVLCRFISIEDAFVVAELFLRRLPIDSLYNLERLPDPLPPRVKAVDFDGTFSKSVGMTMI